MNSSGLANVSARRIRRFLLFAHAERLTTLILAAILTSNIHQTNVQGFYTTTVSTNNLTYA
jgi:phosphoribosylpyrophosphate synthetase